MGEIRCDECGDSHVTLISETYPTLCPTCAGEQTRGRFVMMYFDAIPVDPITIHRRQMKGRRQRVIDKVERERRRLRMEACDR